MLKLTHADYEALRAHGEETYPHECCGALLGTAMPDGNQVRSIVRAGNTRTDRAHDRYNIAPEELTVRHNGRRLILTKLTGLAALTSLPVSTRVRRTSPTHSC
jgi:proteasome lid subunit RPN8/RPN11